MKLLCTLIAAALLAGCSAPPKDTRSPSPSSSIRLPTLAESIAEQEASFARRAERAQKAQREADAENAARRTAFVAANPDLPEADRTVLLRGGYALGWPADWVRASRGEPQRTSTSVSALGTFESWTYRSGHEIVYFLNGRVSRWHHSD